MPPLVRAAEYVRMSTDHQRYSTENQAATIQTYAARRGMEIVRTHADEGKSGLRIEGRDADESAYCEYICRRAGIAVHYCAEQFENDGGPVSTIIKSVKRAMAGEYSRELSI